MNLDEVKVKPAIDISQWLRKPNAEPSLLELSRGEASHRHKSMKIRNSAKNLEISDFLYNFAAEEQLKR